MAHLLHHISVRRPETRPASRRAFNWSQLPLCLSCQTQCGGVAVVASPKIAPQVGGLVGLAYDVAAGQLPRIID
jgi:hypothetical protein